MPKTGSTAIQNALASNRDRLAERDLRYPAAATRGSAHHPLAWSAALPRRPRDDVPGLQQTLSDIYCELEGFAGSVVFSSEALFHLPMSELRPVFEWSETLAGSVVAVAYVRPPAAFHEAWYRQLVKTSGYDKTFDQHLAESPVIDARSRLHTFETLVGPVNFVVRPYLRSSFTHGDVVRDFFSALDIPTQALGDLTQVDANPSLDVDLVEFKGFLHRSGVQHSSRLANALVEWSSSRVHPRRSLFTPETWEAFVASTEPHHMEVLDRYHLPRELVDQRPLEFTGNIMSFGQLDQLLKEFRDRFPVVARDCLDVISSRRE